MITSGNTVYLQTGDHVTANAISQLFLTPGIVSNVIITAAGGTDPSTRNTYPAAVTSTIVFDSTLFVNCTFIGLDTSFIFHSFTHTFDNVVFQGSFLCDFLCPELFGAKGNGTDANPNDDSDAFQECLNAAISTHIYRIRLFPRTYLITKTLYYKGNILLEGTHHYNMYHTGIGSCILANMPNDDKFHYALDSDCYTYENHTLRFDPLATFNSGSLLYYEGEDSNNTRYAAPIHIKNIAFKTTNQTFGAIRAIGYNNGVIEGVTIHGFTLGIALCKGWNFKVERVEMRIGWWGMHLGGEVTESLFQSIQCYCDVSMRTLPLPENSVEQQFFSALFPNDSEVAQALWDGDTTPRSIAYIGRSTSGTFNSCTMEKFDIGILGNHSRLTYNTPYVEYINQTIACIHNGCIMLNNMVGTQSFIANNCYAAIDLLALIVMNNCHPGGFYRTCSDSSSDSERYNALYYNHKAYVVTNHNKIAKPLRYDDTSYLDYDVGDTLYVLQHHYSEYISGESPTEEEIQQAKDYADSVNSALDIYCGNYYINPITLKAALERIRTDFNYRHVDKIVIVQNNANPISSLIIDDSYTWACRHRLTVMRDRRSKTMVFNNIQNICCDVTFKDLTINLNSSLCKIHGVSCQELRFEDDYVNINNANCYLVDNTGTLPADGFAKYISIYLYQQPSVHNYYRNTWNASDDATRFVVDVYGTYNGGGNS